MKKAVACILCGALAWMLAGCTQTGVAVFSSSDQPEQTQTVGSSEMASVVSVQSGEDISKLENNKSSAFFLGTWEYLPTVQDENGEYTFIYQLTFEEDNSVTYLAGWKDSDIASIYVGGWFFDGEGTLTLEMENEYEIGEPEGGTGERMDTVLHIERDNDGGMWVTLVSGDRMFYSQEENAPVRFTI